MSPLELTNLLATLRLFRDVSREVLHDIANRAGAVRRGADGEVVFEPDDAAEAIYVAVRLRPTPIGAMRDIAELCLEVPDSDTPGRAIHVMEGEPFGEFEFVASGLTAERMSRRSTARLRADCHLICIPFTLLAFDTQQLASTRARLVRLAFERLVAALTERSRLVGADGDTVLANWLVDAAENFGIAEGRRVRFEQPIPQREIAAAIGVARETVSLRLKEWQRAGLIDMAGRPQRLEISDYPRVALRARHRRTNHREIIAAGLAEIDADLGCGELVRARNIGLDLLAFFPSSPELRHRVALATVRAGAPREALEVLALGGYATQGDLDLLRDRVRSGLRFPTAAAERGAVGADSDDDWSATQRRDALVRRLIEDLAAIEARVAKELAFAAAEPRLTTDYATASARYYERLFTQLGSVYSGVNAALMSAVAGDHDKAVSLARAVIARVEGNAASYWDYATLAEARAMVGDMPGAVTALRAAASKEDASDGKIATTRVQLTRLARYARYADADRLLDALPMGRLCVYAGPWPTPADGFSDAAEATLRDQLQTVLAGIRYLYGGLAAGPEIVAAEMALSGGAALHVVLPCAPDAYVVQAVAPLDSGPALAGARWVERFWACLRRATTVTVAFDSQALEAPVHASRLNGLRFTAGLALLRADQLATEAPALLALGRPDAPVAALATRWRALERPYLAIGDAAQPGSARAAPTPDPFRPVVFIWPTAPGGLAMDLVPLAAANAQANGIFALSSHDRRSGAALVAADTDGAVVQLRALLAHCRQHDLPVRLVAGYGRVLDAKGRPQRVPVAALPGGHDLVGMPPQMALATAAFAAVLRCQAPPGIRLIPLHRSAGEADGRQLAAQEVYSLVFD